MQINGLAVATMLGLCLTWGLQQVAIKAIASDVPPLLQVATRSGVAALLVWLLAKFVLRDRWLPAIALRSGLVVGMLFATEFLLIAEGLRWTSASHMAVLLYTAPLFSALGLHLRIPEERLMARQWVGLVLAFIGILVMFVGPQASLNTGHSSSSAPVLFGDLLALAAGAAWGMTTIVVRTTRLSEAPPTQTLFHQLLIAFVVLPPIALAFGPHTVRVTTMALASLGFQALVVSFASYLIWFWLLRNYLAARLGVLSFMTPFFGVSFGVLLLDEVLNTGFIVGAALALVGLVIVNATGQRPNVTHATDAPVKRSVPRT